MSCQLTLFIPGLLNPPAGFASLSLNELPDLSALLRLLSRAEVTTTDHTGFYPELFAAFGLEIEDGDYPLAAMTHFMRQGKQDQQWRLRIDPVCVQAGLTAAYMVAHEGLQLESDEVSQIVTTLNQHFAQDGWRIELAESHHWYLTGSDKKNINTTPLHRALGRNVGQCLPEGEDAGYWRSVMNETQMLLHQHPVNRLREEAGQLMVNSVWLWGGGVLPDLPEPHWSHVYADDLISGGLARLSDTPVNELAAFMTRLAKRDFAGNDKLLIIDDDMLARQHGYDLSHWLTSLHELEQHLFAPLLKVLKSGKLDELSIMSGDGREFRIKTRQLKRWWRRDKPLSKWIREDNDTN